MAIPNFYHFIQFSESSGMGSNSFSFINYLAVLSCVRTNNPQLIHFYCDEVPSGMWWEHAKPHLTVVSLRAPDHVHGIPVVEPAHRSDVARLQILVARGGIYLDLDVLCLRPFAAFQDFDVVMGEEYGVGLGNAVILASRGAPFLQRWLDSYADFDADDWNRHSVRVPAKLARDFPAEIHVLPHRSFFWPTYRAEHLKTFFEGPNADFCGDSYCVHLWQSLSRPYLDRVTPQSIWESESEFCILARRFIDKRTAQQLRC